MKQIYRITFPNGKIYIGSDLTGDILYFGSPNRIQIEKDFIPFPLKFSLIKDILWESESELDSEVHKKEKEFIVAFKSNNPEIGYNLNPKFKKKVEISE